ncbi:Protein TRIGALACTOSYLDIACYLGLYCEROL 3 chloroplastic [Zea mays]|uniref:Protein TRIGALACTOSYLDIACYLGLYCEROL 3 chloroplastic n=1 Tax=Zea mays TaxID=4577 RepID=A0A1D6P752_MAIZE|nr:Protein TRIGALACTOSYLDIACYLGLYCEROL 3 chloroplastic [Zea mays]
MSAFCFSITVVIMQPARMPQRDKSIGMSRHGEAVGIIGPSGTGKSTILKVMAGLLALDKGDVIICGKKRHGLVSDEDIEGLRIGLVFQSAAFFYSLTVRENVGFLLYENSSLPEDRIGELVKETLAAVGLKMLYNTLAIPNFKLI